MDSSIQKIFNDEVRQKKRIGSNIFSRASTRKGGSKQALRTPYFYMSQKERKQLNGEVVVFNMNDILDYSIFKEKEPSEQKKLMEYWREKYKIGDIQDKLGISHNTFYKILDRLDIARDRRTNSKKIDRITLGDEELDKYTKEFLSDSIFRKLPLDQQSIILEAYVNEYGSVRSVVLEWEPSVIDEGYLYSIRSRMKKKMNKAKIRENVVDTTSSVIEPAVVEEIEDTPVTSSDNHIEENHNPEILEVDKYSEGYVDKNHGYNISMDTNTFSFNLKGSFTAETIKKRLALALEVLEDDGELLNLEISITNRK
ncbi:hypothetical protein [Peribacillus asahii]|uniref:hypothetical protein n=1 Tax=Peribacillus asahii TaxID=228899 RepID=UPI00381C1940